MRKTTLKLGIGVLLLFVFSLLMPVRAEGPTPWTPDPVLVPGYTHQAGVELTADDTPLLTGVYYLRVDFWNRDNLSVVASITVENETNIFDQPLPEDVATAIENATSQLSDYNIKLEIKTIWDLLRLAVPAFALMVDGLYSDPLSPEDYPGIDDGVVLYSTDFTLAIAKDEGLAVICSSYPVNEAPKDSDELKAIVDALIIEINKFVDEALSAVNGVSIAAEGDAEPSSDVLKVLDHITYQYGETPKESSTIDGFPLGMTVFMSIISMAVLIRKKKQ